MGRRDRRRIIDLRPFEGGWIRRHASFHYRRYRSLFRTGFFRRVTRVYLELALGRNRANCKQRLIP